MVVTVAGEQLILHSLKGVFWEKMSCLFLADLHLGKATHFRKSGYAVPVAVSDSNWNKLISLLIDFKPERVIMLGDLFHSDYNSEWEDLAQLIEQFSQVRFELVMGNHDILDQSHYNSLGLIVHQHYLELGPFLCTHEPLKEFIPQQYNLSGHIHPCVRIRGRGRQRLRLPCFYFGKRQGILPAFGAFTGMAEVQPKKGDQVFVIAVEEVIQVS